MKMYVVVGGVVCDEENVLVCATHIRVSVGVEEHGVVMVCVVCCLVWSVETRVCGLRKIWV